VKENDCPRCKAGGPKFKPNHGKEPCFVCNEIKVQVLNLHHTNAILCSLECEETYWLDIAF
jgi:hypothetical protein